MKQLFILLIALLAFTSGCRKKTTKKPVTTESVAIKEDQTKTPEQKPKKESIFLDEAIDKFALQEEEKDEKVEKTEPEKIVEPAPTDTFAPAEIKKNDAVTLFEEEAADKAIEATEQQASDFKTIYFDFDRFEIRKDQLDILNHNLDAIKKRIGEDKKVTIVIEGHACRSAGSDSYNMILSEKRANSVRNWMIKRGIKRANFKIVGRGSEECIVPAGSREEQAPNRRVEFHPHQ